MEQQQWNEFLDKLDFVQLTERWSLLPLHWLDAEIPSEASELGRSLATALLQVRDLEDEVDRHREIATHCAEYRRGLSTLSMSLGATMCPPGSRVTLNYLNPEDLGRGDCFITLGSWDRVGHLVARLANPSGDYLESVGEEPVRIEAGALDFRDLLLFPDKGKASPRAFRALCEKTLRQARGLGARHLSLTHLQLPQTGLGDRFAAAEVVSAVRQIVREGPGTTVDILVFSHRHFEDYKHWFESLGTLGAGSPRFEAVPTKRQTEPSRSTHDVTDTLKSLARRSSDFATEASASVSQWIAGNRSIGIEKIPVRKFDFDELSLLSRLFLGDSDDIPSEPEWESLDPIQSYLYCLQATVAWEKRGDEVEGGPAFIKQRVTELASYLGETHFLYRYCQLLELRLWDSELDVPVEFLSELLEQAHRWEDLPLEQWLSSFQEERNENEFNSIGIPVAPAGSRENIASDFERVVLDE